MRETNFRSLAKAVSWRLTGTADTFILSWLITGEVKVASTIALSEVFTKVALYWLHERVWDKIRLGKIGR
jgi:uncharacterized membrane protein